MAFNIRALFGKKSEEQIEDKEADSKAAGKVGGRFAFAGLAMVIAGTVLTATVAGAPIGAALIAFGIGAAGAAAVTIGASYKIDKDVENLKEGHDTGAARSFQRYCSGSSEKQETLLLKSRMKWWIL